MPAEWREFEQVAFKIQQDLSPGSEVLFDQKIPGHDSQIDRQIDILIRHHIGQLPLLVIMDCKNYNSSVNVNHVGQFATVVTDVRANKGAMITKKGFSEAALNLAKQRGIETYVLIDTQTTRSWRRLVSIPALLQWTKIRKTILTIKNFSELADEIKDAEWHLLELFAASGESLGLVHDAISAKWNSKEIPHEPGEFDVTLMDRGSIGNASARSVATVIVKASVVRQYFFGNVPVDLQGLRDEQKGHIYTREFTTSILEPAAIANGSVPDWCLLDDPQSLAARPVLKMSASPVLPHWSLATDM